MKKALSVMGKAVLVAVAADVMILGWFLLQVAAGERVGYANEFWRQQAITAVSLLGYGNGDNRGVVAGK